MLLLELQLRRVLDGDDAFLVGDEVAEAIEQGRLAGAGPARHDDVPAVKNRSAEEIASGRSEGLVTIDQVVHGEFFFGMTPDRQAWALEGHRGDDGIDAAAVGQARVGHGLTRVDLPTGALDKPADDRHGVGGKAEAGVLDDTVLFDENVIGVDDHDLADAGIVEQVLQRPKTIPNVFDFLDEATQGEIAAQAGRQRLLLCTSPCQKGQNFRSTSFICSLRSACWSRRRLPAASSVSLANSSSRSGMTNRARPQPEVLGCSWKVATSWPDRATSAFWRE